MRNDYEYDSNSSLIVLENDNWYWKGYEEFLKTLSDSWFKMNPKVDDSYSAKHSMLYFVMLLFQPHIRDVAVCSAFQSGAYSLDANDKGFKEKGQLEFFMPLLFEVLRFRKSFNYPNLTFHIVYNSEISFVETMMEGDFGEEAKRYFTLMMRQNEDFTVIVYDYQTYNLIDIITHTTKDW